MKTDRQVKTMVMAGLLTAIVVVVTMFVQIPIPNLVGGYINAGDAVCYACAFLLGWPVGAICAGLGSALADLLLGSVVYAPATLVIKFAMTAVAAMGLRYVKKKAGRVWVLALAGLVMLSGYFAYEWILFGWGAAMASLLFNLIQYAAGIVLGLTVIHGMEILHK